MTFRKSVFAILTAMVLFAALSATASGGRLSTSSQTFRSTFREFRFGGGGLGTSVCQLTLEGSLHTRTTSKTVNSLIGYVTAANAGSCTTGSVTILRELLPWHIRYRSFTGTLPNITGIGATITEFNARIREPIGIICLAESEALHPAVISFSVTSGVLTSAAIVGTDIPALCEPNGFPILASYNSNNGSVTVLNSSARITVTLI